jgi:1-acyl-sn-glycerol-3-phosphate acyltransferase
MRRGGTRPEGRIPVSKREERGYSPGWRTGTTIYLPPLIKSLMKRDWRGHQHFPADGGMIVAANHLSYADWPAMSLFVHEAGRYPAFLIKSSAFDVKLVGPYLRKLGQLPVYRGQADAALVLKDGEQALAAGECLVIYPEGTATRDPGGWPMVAKTGVARLALASGVPVVPVAQWGAQDILPYGSTKPHLVPRKTVHMLAGPPVDLSEYAGKPLTRQTLRGATDAIMADITALLAEIRGERPPSVPYDPAAARRAARQESPAHNLSSQTEPAADEPRKAAPP